MKLIEVFQQLSVGEFSQLAIGNGGSGVILLADQEKLMPHINLALTALYKRFNLKEGRLTVELVTGKYTYEIHSRFVRSAETALSASKYLVETDGYFQDDVLKIERAITQQGYGLALNDESEAYSVFTPSVTKLRVPADIVNQSTGLPELLRTSNLELVYRANHPKLGVEGTFVDMESIELELPESYMEAMLYFVASRIHNPIGMTNEFHAGNTYYSKYLAACQELENQNLQTDRTGGNTRAQRGGWA